MQIEVENPSGPERFRGGFGDVFKCTYQNLDVALKVLRVHHQSRGDWEKINRVSYRPSNSHCHILRTCRRADCNPDVLQGGSNVEIPPPPKRFTAAWSAEGQVLVRVRDGVGVDGERESQELREGSQGCKSL